MRDNVRGQLALLHPADQIDVVYVSHIDQDHISGVLQLLEDLLEWKVFEHHNDPTITPPSVPRPPEIGGIWHNAFRDLITRNRGRIEALLAANAPTFFGTSVPEAMQYAEQMQKISTSIPEALKVSRLVRADLLDIELNRPPGRPDPGQLLLIEDPNDPFPIGSLSFQLIGPSKSDLRNLRKGWDNWLRDEENRAQTREIREDMQRRVEEFANGTLGETPFDLRRWNGIPDFKGVTVPNTASLMFLVEDNDGSTLLLTGDSQQDIILDGLTAAGQLANGFVHVDVLKVPHHGSEHNADENFCRRVSADHYVFCGNGSHGNPEPEVLDLYFNSRLGSANQLALSPEAQDPNRPFTFWFSTESTMLPANSAARANFEEVERRVANMAGNSNGRMSTVFNNDDFVVLDV